MAGLCEGGNEPSGSLKAICNVATLPNRRRTRLLTPSLLVVVETPLRHSVVPRRDAMTPLRHSFCCARRATSLGLRGAVDGRAHTC
ncbi:hypothetical protein ANN_12565 [Periplaneta americana]|uniref:Uncharacterized protein n=1 Tax=Periplaneta americana TaxID=6978 RepID=A0ABQ8TJ61_PERAM|nr:hypothetical protein ANN_12565 [Periplaneta americana]